MNLARPVGVVNLTPPGGVVNQAPPVGVVNLTIPVGVVNQAITDAKTGNVWMNCLRVVPQEPS